jgi:hypothetical protein
LFRGYIELINDPPVRKFISIAGMLNGIYAKPGGFYDKFICNQQCFEAFLKDQTSFYEKQNSNPLISFWKFPFDKKNFDRLSSLSILNNLTKFDQKYKTRFA